MSDQDGNAPLKSSLTNEQRTTFINHLETHWKSKECEVCKTSKWSVADDLVMPMTFTGGGLSIGGPTYPQVMVICTTCGNTKYFNALVAEVLKKDGGV